MIIGITGYGCTGASAVIDLLQEFEDVQSYRSSVEFQVLQQPDGILDLHYHVVEAGRRLSNNVAIKRFIRNINSPGTGQIRRFTNNQYEYLSMEYIRKIIQIQWKGKSAFDPPDLRLFYDTLRLKLFNKVVNKCLNMISKKMAWPPKGMRYFAMLDEHSFVKITREYIRDLLNASGFDLNKPIILEQLFNTSEPLAGVEYVDEPISIIVDRDPRDVYLLMNHYYSRGTSFMPDTGDVEQFITYYKNLHRKVVEDPRVIYVQFEDLIYDYNKTCEKIEIIMQGRKHIHKGQRFKPECSINNTMLYQKFPQYSDEIKKIEEELSEYLYPFEEKRKQINFVAADVGMFDRQVEVKKKLD